MLKRFDHVGVIVDDLSEAVALLNSIGLVHDRDVDLPGRLKASFWTCGDAQIEVIEILEPIEREKRLGSDKARIEHIAIEVDELQSTLKALALLGIRPQSSEPLQVGTSVNIWTQPETSDGVIYQLIERSR